MNDNFLAIPFLLPLIGALLLVILNKQVRLSRMLSLIIVFVSFVFSLVMLIYVVNNEPLKLDFSGWRAPFGIQYVGDALSLLLVTTTHFVVFMIIGFGFGRGEKRASRYYLPSFVLFLTVGVVGSFFNS